MSGTGKSRLVSAVAKAVYDAADVRQPWLTIIEIRPDWRDGAPLLGHYDPIAKQYVKRRFLDALLAASSGDSPVFVCLDEMNLARVEYYLADCLSAMESGNPIVLDSRGNQEVPEQVQWPRNLYLFGTVNVDESTFSISDKVLDRAQVIDSSDIDLEGPLNAWLNGARSLKQTDRDRVKSIIMGIWNILRTLDAHFGFRTVKAIVNYVDQAIASSDGSLSVDAALEMQVRQKILVKLRGEGERWIDTLSELEEVVNRLGTGTKSSVIVSRMSSDLERLGSFQFWN
ncbi:hypothetical protein IGS68_00720 [Skermanella sp. TT6]|uniref:ATPase dynein-related AAA domain-containing protein n=1 Tax=Skermanella cutis TaxID=2775420 RepID=A0ABX7BBM2_9PROT|nr:hypothetical protein [Skermanella sp. TT6]QQP89837.1 hypothetical protein IGS68_00720 [Skermanella sp. TT6]